MITDYHLELSPDLTFNVSIFFLFYYYLLFYSVPFLFDIF